MESDTEYWVEQLSAFIDQYAAEVHEETDSEATITAEIGGKQVVIQTWGQTRRERAQFINKLETCGFRVNSMCGSPVIRIDATAEKLEHSYA
jgi:hypothetical protein